MYVVGMIPLTNILYEEQTKMTPKKNTKITETENVLSNVLDPQDLEVFVVRGRDCEIVFSNAKAKERYFFDEYSARICKTSSAICLPGICDHCRNGGKNTTSDTEMFDLKDSEGRTYTARQCAVNWFDGKPATVFFLRETTQEIESKERLRTLAYIDQLTGVPNRQRLKDDFNLLLDSIAEDTISGIVALFDLDNFKTVNDTYGHNTGDLVLRRLTEHLEEDELFSGHLYRLGGDEFVFLFVDPADKFASEDEIRLHYSDVLSNALRAYTLPNIEVQCTLSIGVSAFPKHGKNLSEVLRKADIALYKAKAGGRNQIVFFESQYDAAQKFKDLYINIQPILYSSGVTFGYELIDRGNSGAEDKNTVNLGEFNRTVDALGLSDIENNMQYFMMYSKQLLEPSVLKNLPRDKFIIQVQLTEPHASSDFKSDMRTCFELRDKGYRLALAGLHSNNYNKELLAIADFCKFHPADDNIERQKNIIAENNRVKFIATNTDTPEAFRKANEAGFHMFQGYYFSQPVVDRKTKEISPLKANYFRLLKLSSTEGYMDFHEISSVISSDVALSYKLLRILNSAAVGLRNVTSVAVAVAYLGEENLKRWIAVLALRGIAEDKPLELVRMSLVRARFGELLSTKFGVKQDPKKVFVVGLLSLLHIALDMTKEQLVEEIAVADDIRDSLLSATGDYSELLRFYENYEYSNWDAVSQFVEENKLDPKNVNDAYITSIKWYNDLVSD